MRLAQSNFLFPHTWAAPGSWCQHQETCVFRSRSSSSSPSLFASCRCASPSVRQSGLFNFDSANSWQKLPGGTFLIGFYTGATTFSPVSAYNLQSADWSGFFSSWRPPRLFSWPLPLLCECAHPEWPPTDNSVKEHHLGITSHTLDWNVPMFTTEHC